MSAKLGWDYIFNWKVFATLTFSNRFSSLKMKIDSFNLLVFMFTKCKNTFSKHLLCPQDEKDVFEAFSCLQDEMARFWGVFSVYKIKMLLWSVFMFTKWKNTIPKRFEVFKNEELILETFFKMETHFEACFMFTKLKKKKTHFWSVFQV